MIGQCLYVFSQCRCRDKRLTAGAHGPQFAGIYQHVGFGFLYVEPFASFLDCEKPDVVQLDWHGANSEQIVYFQTRK
jgi:hypothetical protein